MVWSREKRGCGGNAHGARMLHGPQWAWHTGCRVGAQAVPGGMGHMLSSGLHPNSQRSLSMCWEVRQSCRTSFH